MSNVTLKLDSGAMNSLFPEGSEARVQLQSAVVANVLDKITVKHLTKDAQVFLTNLLNKYEGEFRDIAAEVLSEKFRSSSYMFNNIMEGTFDLNSETRQRVSDFVKSRMEISFKETVGFAAETYLKDTQYIDTRIKSHLDSLLDNVVKTRVTELFNKALSLQETEH